MYILAIETTGRYGSAAVITDKTSGFSSCGKQLVTASSDSEMNHLKDVISVTDEALGMAGIDKTSLGCVAASVGPGSFTGIRIGVTTARTLAQMWRLPCVGVSSLEAMAHHVRDAAATCGCSYVMATINARRHQTYAGVWKLDAGTAALVPLHEERQYMIEELLELVKSDEAGSVYLVGDGIDAYEEIIVSELGENCVLADAELRYQTAESVAERTLGKALAGEVCEYEDLLPDYMRLSEAEQRLAEGTLSKKIR